MTFYEGKSRRGSICTFVPLKTGSWPWAGLDNQTQGLPPYESDSGRGVGISSETLGFTASVLFGR